MSSISLVCLEIDFLFQIRLTDIFFMKYLRYPNWFAVWTFLIFSNRKSVVTFLKYFFIYFTCCQTRISLYLSNFKDFLIREHASRKFNSFEISFIKYARITIINIRRK